jgi:AcrR family transcriptional regulator
MTESALQLTPKRIEIADAALGIIGRNGIAALTTTALAAELGVSAGAPFRHFANRGEILEAVALRVEELILQTFPDRSGPAAERIRLLFRARARTVGRHAGIASLMFSEQFTLALPGPAAERLRNLVARTRAYLLEALQEGVGQGSIRADPPPEALLPIVMGTLQHLVFAHALGLAQDGEVDGAASTLLGLLAPGNLPRARQE